jgi:hypothetical protein
MAYRKINIQDFIGKKYSRWTVLEHVGSDEKFRRIVRVMCDCGTERTVRMSELTYGRSQSCGCYNREVISRACTKHGVSHTSPLYKTWSAMKQRCYNPKQTAYKHYGGRGIYVCDEWREDFAKFEKWCQENGYKKGLEIDRIDNDRGYSAENCRWVTRRENMKNTRRNILVTYGGETKAVSDWCEQYELPHNVVTRRIDRKWPTEKLFIPSTRLSRLK